MVGGGKETERGDYRRASKERNLGTKCNGNLIICLFADLTPVPWAPRF